VSGGIVALGMNLLLMIYRLLYGLQFPMSEEAQKDDFVIPVRPPKVPPTIILY
jgi:hypothetical protein